MFDVLAGLDLNVRTYDIKRTVSVYPDNPHIRWWTKAWFNGNEEGAPAVEIEKAEAVRFICDEIGRDEMLEKYFPELMKIYHQVLEQTKEQIIGSLKI